MTFFLGGLKGEYMHLDTDSLRYCLLWGCSEGLTIVHIVFILATKGAGRDRFYERR